MAIPALLSKKTGRPGDDADQPRRRALHRPRARRHSPAREDRLPQGRPHHGDGSVRHRGLRSVHQAGRCRHLGSTATALYTPRTCGSAAWRCSPTRRRACRSARRAASRRSTMLEPLISKAARQLGIDQVEIRRSTRRSPARIRSASGAGRCGAAAAAAAASAPAGAPAGPPAWRSRRRRAGSRHGKGPGGGGQVPGSSRCRGARPRTAPGVLHELHLREALDKGAELFKWDERKARNGSARHQGHGRRRRPRHLSPAGSIAMDGCCDSARRQGVHPPGHRESRHGSVHGRLAVVAEVLDMPWEQMRDRLGQHGQEPGLEFAAGRQPDHSRAHARESRGRAWTRSGSCRKSPRWTCGGRPDDYDVANERVSQGRPRADVRAGGRSARSSSAASSTATNCRRTSTR